jgi:hypothetical protein
MERRLTAILAADVVGYSRLMGRDEARIQSFQNCRSLLRMTRSSRVEFSQATVNARDVVYGDRVFLLDGENDSDLDGLISDFRPLTFLVAKLK